MDPVGALLEKLSESVPATAAEAGEHLLEALSGQQLKREEFLNDPLALVGPPFFASRYLAQVTLRALTGDYETVDEVLSSLSALTERNPPILERRRGIAADRVVLPEAKVLDLRYPVKNVSGIWE